MNQPESHRTHQVEILPAQIDKLDGRLKQIEVVTEAIEKITQQGIEVFSKYLENKTEGEKKSIEIANEKHKREVELQDKQHKRAVLATLLAAGSIFILVVFAMIKNEIDLAKNILGSSLAIAAGAGIKGIFTNQKSSKPE